VGLRAAVYSHTNTRLAGKSEPVSRATLHVTSERGRDDALVVLAFSGGGSRAAYWSASTMLQLQKVFLDIDILCEVDVISSVSGGSLPAAYYGISTDTTAPCREPALSKGHGHKWDEKTVKELMTRNYINRWFGNW
jgi:predicted acylesterase/phospholipase RssA